MDSIPTDEDPCAIQHRRFALHGKRSACSIPSSNAKIACRGGLVLLVVLFLAAQAQIHATIVILSLSQNYIILASDSRSGESGHYTDAECKIAALDDQTLYAATGLLRYPAELLGGAGWSGRDIATNALRRLGKASSLRDLGVAWAASMERSLTRSMLLQPTLTKRAVQQDGGITTGIFARGIKNNPFEAIAVYVKYTGSRFIHDIRAVTQGMKSYGEGGAITWIQKRAAGETAPPDLPEQIKRWIAGAIEAHAAQNIGGDVAVVELKRGKPIHWIHPGKCGTK